MPTGPAGSSCFPAGSTRRDATDDRSRQLPARVVPAMSRLPTFERPSRRRRGRGRVPDIDRTRHGSKHRKWRARIARTANLMCRLLIVEIRVDGNAAIDPMLQTHEKGRFDPFTTPLGIRDVRAGNCGTRGWTSLLGEVVWR